MSAILSADDLNDFISPGVACIKPVETLPAAPPPPADGSLEHEVILDGQPGGPASSGLKPNAPAEISLTDCLACSGCVTSAEAVLVSLQSHTEVLNTLDFGPSLRIVGPDEKGQFRVDGLEDESRKLFEAGHMLERLLRGPEGLASAGQHNNGFTWVLDTNVAREACLVLGADEVLGTDKAAASSDPKPTLTSNCPGWVCYAEKTHPHVLPHISKVKSPQALMGTLLKTTLSRKLNIPPSRIWHLAVMPCFDKKLEASREELTDSVWAGDGKPGRGIRDVDCVITSKEVLMLADSRGFDFFSLARTNPSLTRQLFPDPQLDRFLFPPQPAHRDKPIAGSSGGNLYFTLQSVVSKNPGSQIQVIRGRNADVTEYIVASGSGEPIFKAARFYGFRNIQNLIKIDDPIVVERKGLAIKPGPQEQKQWLAEVDEAYFSAEEADDRDVVSGCDVPRQDLVDGISPSHIRDTLAHWSGITGVDLDRLVFTTYREVVSDVGKDKTTDTERVVQLAGKIGGGW
ncbi:General amino acid permease AGP3 [Verticillium dahliae VDG1]|nr:General amino acid permease AGP3 [Verticillium dahliae VDG1]